ncbi:MAG: rRNA pseudouridine synthase [Clostridia bacterium]|nr:rRNA pseudouridine synthase [Clostridia bacterium]
MQKQRLDKFISNQLNISRKDVRTALKRGQATVNGRIEKDAAFTVDTDADVIIFEGKEISYKKYIYILMNKPKGVLSASNDKSRETVVDLVPAELKRAGLFPVGRLDRDTTGLLIITDNGEFAHNCISPKKMISKSYIASLDGEVTEEMCEIFGQGVTLKDGTKCKPAKLYPLDSNKARIIITEGKYHQIKRMFGTVGLGVNELHRESIGGLALPQSLEEGKCIEIAEKEAFSALLKVC